MTNHYMAWVGADKALPDDELTVLLFSPTSDETVWPGYHDAGAWYWADGTPADGVTHWAPMPLGPGQER
jgi:hypothetical protein